MGFSSLKNVGVGATEPDSMVVGFGTPRTNLTELKTFFLAHLTVAETERVLRFSNQRAREKEAV